jgi:hypothetical protein
MMAVAGKMFMSALGQKRTFLASLFDVRVTPESGHKWTPLGMSAMCHKRTWLKVAQRVCRWDGQRLNSAFSIMRGDAKYRLLSRVYWVHSAQFTLLRAVGSHSVEMGERSVGRLPSQDDHPNLWEE